VTRDVVFEEEKKWEWSRNPGEDTRPAGDTFTVHYQPYSDTIRYEDEFSELDTYTDLSHPVYYPSDTQDQSPPMIGIRFRTSGSISPCTPAVALDESVSFDLKHIYLRHLREFSRTMREV
jgi:hypothetical protein